jgi:hypothetical protein
MEDLVDEAAKKAAREAIRIFSEICATGIISGQGKVVNAEVNYSFGRFMQKVVQHAQTELTEDTNFQSGPDLPQHSSLHLPDTIEPRLLHINAQYTTSANVDVPQDANGDNSPSDSTTQRQADDALFSSNDADWAFSWPSEEQVVSRTSSAPVFIGTAGLPRTRASLEPDLSCDRSTSRSDTRGGPAMSQGQELYEADDGPDLTSSQNFTVTSSTESTLLSPSDHHHSTSDTLAQRSNQERINTASRCHKRRKTTVDVAQSEGSLETGHWRLKDTEAEDRRCIRYSIDYLARPWFPESRSMQVPAFRTHDDYQNRAQDLIQFIGDSDSVNALLTLMREANDIPWVRSVPTTDLMVKIYERIIRRDDKIKACGLQQWYDLNELYEAARKVTSGQTSQRFRTCNLEGLRGKDRRGNPRNNEESLIMECMLKTISPEVAISGVKGRAKWMRQLGGRLSVIGERFGHFCLGIAYVSSRQEREAADWRSHV